MIDVCDDCNVVLVTATLFCPVDPDDDWELICCRTLGWKSDSKYPWRIVILACGQILKCAMHLLAVAFTSKLQYLHYARACQNPDTCPSLLKWAQIGLAGGILNQ